MSVPSHSECFCKQKLSVKFSGGKYPPTVHYIIGKQIKSPHVDSALTFTIIPDVVIWTVTSARFFIYGTYSSKGLECGKIKCSGWYYYQPAKSDGATNSRHVCTL